MIKRLRVRNYKALRDVALELTPIHVLIGPNDSGKTSTLEALRALSRSVHYSLADAFEGPWQGRELVWTGEPEPVVSFEVDLADGNVELAYELSCSFSLTGRNLMAAEKASIERPGQDAAATRPSNRNERSFVATTWNQHPSPDQKIAVEIHNALHGAQFYRWIPSQLALPVAFQFPTGQAMETSGFGLAMCLNDIMTNDHAKFGQLENRFCSLFPYINKIRLRREPGYVTGRDAHPSAPGIGISFEMADSGDVVPASRASDGLLLVLAYVAILYSPEPPRLLLIEEPENGIHPVRLQEVLKILRQLVEEHKRTQIVLTTHSPYAVDVFQPEEVTLCQKGPDGAVTTLRLSKSKRIREQLDVFRLGEIWTAEGDEALATPVGQD